MPLGPNPAQQKQWDAYQQAKLDHLIAVSRSLMDKPEPKKESKFLDQVQSAIDRRRIFRKRVAALMGGPLAIACSPVIGMELYKWWRWTGVAEIACSGIAILVVAGILIVSTVFIAGALDKDLYKTW